MPTKKLTDHGSEILISNNITFVLGGARSGKSACAESIALAAAQSETTLIKKILYYLATAQIFDDEMQTRIDLHQARRGDEWSLLEAPVDLVSVLVDHDAPDAVFLVDCLSVWTTNLLLGEKDLVAARNDLIAHIEKCQATLIFVASETGLGIVPDNALSRKFRDASGLLNQYVARAASEVFFVTAGIANKIK